MQLVLDNFPVIMVMIFFAGAALVYWDHGGEDFSYWLLRVNPLLWVLIHATAFFGVGLLCSFLLDGSNGTRALTAAISGAILCTGFLLVWLRWRERKSTSKVQAERHPWRDQLRRLSAWFTHILR